jgi:hypothetical protein
LAGFARTGAKRRRRTQRSDRLEYSKRGLEGASRSQKLLELVHAETVIHAEQLGTRLGNAGGNQTLPPPVGHEAGFFRARRAVLGRRSDVDLEDLLVDAPAVTQVAASDCGQRRAIEAGRAEPRTIFAGTGVRAPALSAAIAATTTTPATMAIMARSDGRRAPHSDDLRSASEDDVVHAQLGRSARST